MFHALDGKLEPKRQLLNLNSCEEWRCQRGIHIIETHLMLENDNKRGE
jgi:hypothetical protein